MEVKYNAGRYWSAELPKQTDQRRVATGVTAQTAARLLLLGAALPSKVAGSP